MSLRHALLALLSAEPMTGYDVFRYFETSVSYAWHAPHTQIYPELRRLEESGLVSSEQVSRGERGRKRRYHITDAGLAEFRRWMNDLLPLNRERDSHKLKAAYFEWAAPDAARRQLTAHIVHYEDWARQLQRHIEQIEARDLPLLRRRLEHLPADQHEAVVRYKAFAYRGMVRRARTEIEWAREGLALIDELAGGAAPPDRDG